MAKIQIEILLNFERFEDSGRISYEVLYQNAVKDRLECPYCAETIDIKFGIFEEFLDDDTKNDDTSTFLNEFHADLAEKRPLEDNYVSDSDETLSTGTLLNMKYQKEIEEAISCMKIDTLDEASLINFIEETTKIIEPEEILLNEPIFEPIKVECASPQLLDPDSTKLLSDEEEKVAKPEPSICHICPCKRIYKVEKFFLKHMKQYHPDFALEDCEKIQKIEDFDGIKPKRDGSRPIHRCNVCEKVYWSRRSYRRHMVTTHPDDAKRLNLQAKTYRCQYCSKVYFTSELLNQHLLLHVNPDHYQCGNCNKSFVTHNNLKRHINAVHLGIKSFICEVCGVRFNQRYSLRLHHQELHGTGFGYECNECGKIYGTKDKLKIHIKWTHLGYGKTNCKICGKTFLINNIKRHLRDVHKEGKQLEYPCRFCEKIFNRRAYRDIHECTHTGEKRYSCKICHERFTDPGYRYAHMRKCHSDEFEQRKRRKVNKTKVEN
ncbi:zinc finger protein 558-like [Culicoides brevitarsis]|uniref:zinc finger protein 558-like n=1 Tax=Culicoides brevitarsis TaxID=469753 RepID=UPI00307C1409